MVYNGSWANGEKNGQGVLIFEDGTVYSNSWKDGKEVGDGVYTWPDGFF